MNSSPKLPLRIKLLYSVGDISTSAPLSILIFYQLFFLTDVAGLRPSWAGTAVLIGRLWDALNDPLFGLLSDRVRSRYGRRRVVLLCAAVPFGLTFLLQFLVPPFGERGLIAYYAFSLILFDTAYTAVHVSFNALTPQLTKDYDERSSLNGYRMAFSIAGSLAAVILATVLGWFISNQRVLFATLGFIISFAAIIPLLSVVSVTKAYDLPLEEETSAPLTLKEAIQATFSNRPFWMLMALYLFSWTTASLIGSVIVFFANYYLRSPSQANFLVLVAQTSAILFIPFWVWTAKRFDKRHAFMAGCASWMIVLLALANVRPDQIVLTYILAALSGAGIATAYFLPWAMIPDIVEMDELTTGRRRAGTFYSFAALFQKVGTALVIWLFGLALEIRGYIIPTADNPFPIQPPEAVQAVRWAIGLVPAILLIGAIVFAYLYPITRESHRLAQEQIAARLTME